MTPTKQSAILQAALKLFAAQGFHGVSVPEVAKLAGVGAGTIYRYFESKEALVNALYQQHKQALAEALLRDFPATAPPREQFHALWSRAIGFARRHGDVVNFLEVHHHGDYLDAESKKLGKHFESIALAFFERAAKVGAVKKLHPHVLMALVWGAFTGFMKAHWEGRLPIDDETLAAYEQCLWEAIRL
ncbi:MAG: TetR/AcrR family transcriptional regulator [Myxococcota bacterium]